MSRLFQGSIKNWTDWGQAFQSIPAFEGLAREICRREGLPFAPLQNLTPGTNAVFRSGSLLLKIFFPKESGLDPLPDFQNEAAVCGRLAALGVPTPRLLAQGHIDDKYRFYYLIFEYFPGVEAGAYLESASPAQKKEFVEKLRLLLSRLNLPADGLIPETDLAGQALRNPRFGQLSPALRQALRSRAQSLELSKKVLVHGDLTGENLLVSKDGRLVVIDCADARLAPAWYELGPIVFELFRCGPFLLKELAGDDREAFLERTLDAVSIHDFGPDLLLEAARREGLPPFAGLSQVKGWLAEKLGL